MRGRGGHDFWPGRQDKDSGRKDDEPDREDEAPSEEGSTATAAVVCQADDAVSPTLVSGYG